ncbi:unnamed protein product [Tilletia controversa]|uniref:Uncharacterized protein n=3 Tax=Tilletia TaxID=13289 RepID=A0A8X7SZW5_9BASI|nr:hypothetical protein CF336_g698 [Tilletia laevis]KAE8204562.1 hypothetical protein CF328_g1011 [Tilletia controversa]KAE8265066.1 hypothetical protein A4X03_0g506 [Tilletia caries]KAE8208401.1 hypothetical protein CF335_g441 [Tilletia laevis]KAE8253973.1 hypothetical protein A4X06_0g1125 [Tilletia controversa]
MASSATTFTTPAWLTRFLSNFPLHTYPASTSASTSTALTTPTLYVVPPHPSSAPTWASADPRCLRWQLELLFRTRSNSTTDINVVFLDPRTEDVVWGPGGQLPFLHLPTSPSGTTSARNPAGNLVGVAGLQHWADNYHPYPWDRPELGEKADASPSSARPYPSEALKLEAQSWITLLETNVLAGLLMQLLTMPALPPRPSQQPALLTRLLASSLLPSALYRLSLLRRLSYLTPLHPTSHPSPLPAFLSWLGAVEFSHPFSLPGGADAEKNSTALIGKSELEREEIIGDRARAGDWRSCRSERDEAKVLELALREGSGSALDLLSSACEAIEAVGVRFEADGEGAERKWALDAESPAPLDALLFSLLHTILSLPVDHAHTVAPSTKLGEGGEDDDPAYVLRAPARSLREAIERHPVLLKWTRRVWVEHVKPAKSFVVQESL